MPNNYNNPQERTEAELQNQRERSAKDSGTANGLVIGSILFVLAGLGSLAAYYSTRPAPTPTTIINTTPTPAASVSPAPQKQTTIIDRTVEKTAPPKVQIVEVEKPVVVKVPATPKVKVVEVPKPIIVPGATKVIQVPTPAAAPTTPSTADKSTTPTATPTPSVQPSTPAGDGADTTTSPSPNTTAPANNN